MLKWLFAALLLLPIASSYAHHDPDEAIFAYCSRTKDYFDRHDKHYRVHGYFSWTIKNKTPEYRNWKATLKTCYRDTGTCKTKEVNIHQNPWGMHAEAHNVFVTEAFPGPGRYPFTVTLDITGDRTEHTEKTCELVIMKP